MKWRSYRNQKSSLLTKLALGYYHELKNAHVARFISLTAARISLCEKYSIPYRFLWFSAFVLAFPGPTSGILDRRSINWDFVKIQSWYMMIKSVTVRNRHGLASLPSSYIRMSSSLYRDCTLSRLVSALSRRRNQRSVNYLGRFSDAKSLERSSSLLWAASVPSDSACLS